MKNILVHGLGQNEEAWTQVKTYLEEDFSGVICPSLFKNVRQEKLSYAQLYADFSAFCNAFDEKINLCGLSLGGMLVLNYALDFPEKVQSLTLIATPYQIPKKLFRLQNLMFKLTPSSSFEKLGLSKSAFMTLLSSMAELDFSERLSEIKCPVLVLCGQKDQVNMKSAERFRDHLTNSKMAVIQQAGHEVNRENPEELATAIQHFWQGKS